VESWRFARVFLRLMARVDRAEQARFSSQLLWFQRKVEESLAGAGLGIVTLEGAAYDPGMPATPINIEDFSEGDDLVVDQMLEPVIIDRNDDSLVRTGTVTLRKAGGGES
jgi:hypothetical protein